MNGCTQNQSELSEYLDGELSPPARARFDEHLSSCADCSRELEQVKSSLRALKTLPAEQPPSDLADRIVAELGDGVAKPAGHRKSRALLVAAAILLFSFGYLFEAVTRDSSAADPSIVSLLTESRGRTKLLERNLAESRAKTAALGREVDELRAQQSAASDLQGKLESLEASFARSERELLTEIRTIREDSRTQLSALETREREQREQRLAAEKTNSEISRRLESQTREIEDLSEQLTLSKSAVAKLESRLRARSAVARATSGRRGTRIDFQRVQGNLDLITAGPLEQLVPALLQVARRRSDREKSNLALAALEEHLGPYIENPRSLNATVVPSEQDGFLARIRRELGDVRDVPPAEKHDRAKRFEQRIRRVVKAWERYKEVRGI